MPAKNPSQYKVTSSIPSDLKDGTRKIHPFPGQGQEKGLFSTGTVSLTPIKKEKMSGDPDCEYCLGKGKMREPGVEDPLECYCVMKKRILDYLENYQNAVCDYDFDITPYKDKNIVLQKITVSKFRDVVKSFLIKTESKLQHATLSAYAVFMKYMQNSVNNELTAIQKIPILILNLCSDPPNKTYGQLLQAVIENRMFSALPTWIYAEEGIHSDRFRFLYGSGFTEFVEKTFTVFGQ